MKQKMRRVDYSQYIALFIRVALGFGHRCRRVVVKKCTCTIRTCSRAAVVLAKRWPEHQKHSIFRSYVFGYAYELMNASLDEACSNCVVFDIIAGSALVGISCSWFFL